MNKEFISTLSGSVEELIEYLIRIQDEFKNRKMDFFNPSDYKELFYYIHNVEIVNEEKLMEENTILASNHCSDLDAPILGALKDNITALAKTDWSENEIIVNNLSHVFKFMGINRNLESNRRAILMKMMKFFQGTENKHLLVFPQGTIADINTQSIEKISGGIFLLAEKKNIPIQPIFIEQSEYPFNNGKNRCVNKTRIVIGDKLEENTKECWLERELEMQSSITNPNVKRLKLRAKHKV